MFIPRFCAGKRAALCNADWPSITTFVVKFVVKTAALIDIIPFVVHNMSQYIVQCYLTMVRDVDGDLTTRDIHRSLEYCSALSTTFLLKKEKPPTRFQYRNWMHPTRATSQHRASRRDDQAGRVDSGPTTSRTSAAVCPGTPQSSCVDQPTLAQPEHIHLLCANVSGRERVHSNTLLPKFACHASRHL